MPLPSFVPPLSWLGALLLPAADGAPPPAISVTANPGPVVAEVHDPGFPQADCSYHGVLCTGDGRVYFAVGAHSLAVFARLYRFDPRSGATEMLWRADSTTPDPGHVAQGKIHSPLGEWRGQLVFCTHTGHYKTRHALPGTDTPVKPYLGGYVLAVDANTGKGQVVAAPLHHQPVTVPIGSERVPLQGEALISSVLDARRGAFYALSWPSAVLVRVDLATGRAREYGRMQNGAEGVPQSLPGDGTADAKPKENPHYQRCCRTLGLDDDGNVYGSTGYGAIWRYDRAQDRVITMEARLEQATAGDMSRLPAHLNQWRTLVWDPEDHVFYGVHWSTSWLFRFDPKKDAIEPVMHWAPVERPVSDYAQLGLAMGPGHTLYGLVHTSPVKKGVQRSVHLLTLDLERRRFRDHGPVAAADGRVLMFNEDCAVAPNGDVYTVGWMEIPAERTEEIRKLRREGGVPEVSYPFVMALVRIPAGRISAAP